MRSLILLLVVITFIGCNKDANISEPILLQIKLNESTVMPPGSEIIVEDLLTRSTTLTILETSSKLSQISAGMTFSLTVDYETTSGFTHIGFRVGGSGEFWLVPVAGVDNSKNGLVSFKIQIPEDVCIDFSKICSQITITEFIATKNPNGEYLISNKFSFDLTMVCGDCDEPTCRNFQTACETTEEQCSILTQGLLDFKEFFDKSIKVGDTIGYCSFVNRYIVTIKGREYQSCIKNNLALFSAVEFPEILSDVEDDRQIICN